MFKNMLWNVYNKYQYYFETVFSSICFIFILTLPPWQKVGSQKNGLDWLAKYCSPHLQNRGTCSGATVLKMGEQYYSSEAI